MVTVVFSALESYFELMDPDSLSGQRRSLDGSLGFYIPSQKNAEQYVRAHLHRK